MIFIKDNQDLCNSIFLIVKQKCMIIDMDSLNLLLHVALKVIVVLSYVLRNFCINQIPFKEHC